MNASKPPSDPALLNTPESWGSKPVMIDARLGQHSESVTKYFEKVAPSRSMARTCGMYRTRFQDKSSVRTNTTFGPPPRRCSPDTALSQTSATLATSSSATAAMTIDRRWRRLGFDRGIDSSRYPRARPGNVHARRDVARELRPQAFATVRIGAALRAAGGQALTVADRADCRPVPRLLEATTVHR